MCCWDVIQFQLCAVSCHAKCEVLYARYDHLHTSQTVQLRGRAHVLQALDNCQPGVGHNIRPGPSCLMAPV